MIVVMNKVYICVNQHFVNLLGQIEKLLRDALKKKKIFLSHAGNLNCLTCVRQSSRKSSTAHSYQCVQCFHICPNSCVAAIVIFNACTDGK